ncbi:hypothetical protein [Halococcus sediminicola]|uniref:hypothetical protein n=1 Tax=Halococcus sediminicola TaxID=1264579 RepID=UPI000A9572B1|nr:hypothetical protein [Halococcus sediminicola]
MTRYIGTLFGGSIESNLGYGTDPSGSDTRSPRGRTEPRRPGKRHPETVGSETGRETP